MRIVFVTNELESTSGSPGGLATYTSNMAGMFQMNGNSVAILLVSTAKSSVKVIDGVCIENVYLPKEDWLRLDYAASIYHPGNPDEADENRKEMVHLMKARRTRDRLYEMNKEKKIDIVHFCNHGGFSYFMGDRIPFVIRISGFLNMIGGAANTPHKDIDFAGNPIRKTERIDNKALQLSRFNICPSNLVANYARENLGIDPLVIESPFLLESGDWEEDVYTSLLKDKKYVLFFGAMKFLKGLHVLANIVEGFLASFKEYYLVMAGCDYELQTEEYGKVGGAKYVSLKSGEYSDRVIYLGNLMRKKLYPVISNAVLCILPSRIENLPNAAIESMALGTIVIGTDGASFEQLIKDRVSGFLCKRDDANDFYRAIVEAINLDPSERNKMIEAARQRVEELKPASLYPKYVDYYKSVIEAWDAT